MSLPSTQSASNSSWDPIQVREMVREAQFGGHHPSKLILGHQEASSFRQFVAANFNETVPARFRDTYFLGLKVEESDLEHDFHVEGEQPDKFQSQVPLLIELPSRKANLEVPSERILNEHWDAAVMRKLIDEKTEAGRKPAFLFLGHHETRLLRRHLAAAFGPEAITNLRDLYYMGLQVIEVDTETFLRTAGCKRVRDFKNRMGRKPKWKDIASGSLWQPDFF